MNETQIREYNESDLAELSHLFYETVHGVNAKDYTKEQLFAWAPSPDCLTKKADVFRKEKTLIAISGGKISGFGSIDGGGYLDFLFVRKDCQGSGVATAICELLEMGFKNITAHASVTALPFFKKRGYAVNEECEAERSGVKLKYFLVQKGK